MANSAHREILLVPAWFLMKALAESGGQQGYAKNQQNQRTLAESGATSE